MQKHSQNTEKQIHRVNMLIQSKNLERKKWRKSGREGDKNGNK